MAFPYKHILLIGATSGIGRALADRFVEHGLQVTAVGRRQDRLDDFVQKHGTDRAHGVAFDIGKIEEIPQFVTDVTTKYPDIDCVFLNAGFQIPTDMTSQEKWDMQQFQQIFHINFTGVVALTREFLPFLKEKKSETTGFILYAAPIAAYSASKAALNSFVLCLREQLRGTNIKVIEISPPAVQTELHDYMGEDAGRKLGMPLDQFTSEAFDGFQAGLDQVVVGTIGLPETFHEIVDKRRKAFDGFAQIMRAARH
ncbi:hypothetical protein FE257_008313 [Aspergillus nanangensis]|uniref:Uncharacterized protein n=1 Tax=Aspergillus nanangensis TaxID=2582783 RepID=A0AAD4CN03_ASPNN|nr:hypothetical protein FE257_008313 [Aspergillus nanangensis]